MAFSTDFRSIINVANVNAGQFVRDARNLLDTAKDNITDLGYTNPEWTNIVPARAPNIGNLPTTPQLNPVNLTLPPEPDAPPELTPFTPLTPGPLPTNYAVKPTLNSIQKPSQIGAAPGAPVIQTDFDFPDPPAALSNQLPAAPVIGGHARPAPAVIPPAPGVIYKRAPENTYVAPPEPSFLSRAAPSISGVLPTVPVLSTQKELEAPQIFLPEFESARPETVADAPTDARGQMQGDYISMLVGSRANADAYVDAWIDRQNPAHRAQMARLESELERYLQGGTGIKESVQDAIINRAREKQSRDAEAVKQAAYTEAASRGFTLPPGALVSAVTRARQEASNNVSKAITDLAVAQMEMEQKNLQFAVTTSASLRSTMVSAALNYMGHIVSLNSQSMDYAKSVFSNVVELYNASVRVFSARVDAYRAYASVFEIQIKAAMYKVEIYKAEIDAVRALIGVDQSRVDLYKTQMDAELGRRKSEIDIFKTAVESDRTLAEIYKLRVDVASDLYKMRIDAFKAENEADQNNVNLYKTQADVGISIQRAEIDEFKALLDSDQSTILAYKTQIDALTSLASLYRAQIEAVQGRASLEKNKLELFQIQVQAYGSQIQAKNSEWSGYNAELSGEELKQKTYAAELSAYGMELDAYKVKISAKTAEIDAIAKENQAKSDNYRSQISAYAARVDAEKTRAMAENESSRGMLNAFQAEMSGFELQTKVELAKYTVESENNAKNATSNLTAQIEGARGMLAYGKSLADISVTIGQTYSQLASAAMGGINTLVAGNEDA